MGMKLGLGIERTLASYPYEIIDFSSALAIVEGRVREKYTYTFDEVMEMK